MSTHSAIPAPPSDSRPVWPLLLWLSQLVVPGAILAYLVARILGGDPPGPVLRSAAAVALAWVLTTLVVASAVRGSAWIVTRRYELLILFVTLGAMVVLIDSTLTLSGAVATVDDIRAQSLEYRGSVSTRHRLVPKTIERPDGPPVHINYRGLRGEEIVAMTSGERSRILFLGGSFVFDFDNNWPGLVEEALRSPGHDIEVLNGAVPGHASLDSAGKLLTDLWLLEPDLIVLCHAWNDIKYFGTLSRDHPYRDFVGEFRVDWRVHPQGLDRLLSGSSLYRLVRRDLVRGMIGPEGRKRRRPMSRRIAPEGLEQFRLSLSTFASVSRAIRAAPVLCKQPRLPVADSPDEDRRRIAYVTAGLPHDRLIEAFAHTDRIVEEVAEAWDGRVLDLNAPFSGRSELFKDHIHLTAAGSREVAEHVAMELEKMLTDLTLGE